MSRLNDRINNRSKKTRYMVTAALFAAFICLTTAYILHIPIGGKGYVHIGDAFIYLGATLLPMPYAIFCAAIGAAMADLITGYAIYIIPTLIIKSILVLFLTSKTNKIINTRNLLGSFIAGFVGWILYMIADGIIYGSFTSAFVFSLIGLVQPIGSFIVFILIGLALDKLDIKKKYFN
ncbi:TIGR04002 family protein [Clostridium sp. CCUG 7971]|uniref:TIGR04002 family protein n=1 Tax=Clostridium sp. CCUG 7971 TaxID=2811414 RepID=UPI00336BC2F6